MRDVVGSEFDSGWFGCTKKGGCQVSKFSQKGERRVNCTIALSSRSTLSNRGKGARDISKREKMGVHGVVVPPVVVSDVHRLVAGD